MNEMSKARRKKQSRYQYVLVRGRWRKVKTHARFQHKKNGCEGGEMNKEIMVEVCNTLAEICDNLAINNGDRITIKKIRKTNPKTRVYSIKEKKKIEKDFYKRYYEKQANHFRGLSILWRSQNEKNN